MVAVPAVAQRSIFTVAWACAGSGMNATASSKANTPVHTKYLVSFVILIAPYCGQALGTGGSTRVKVAGPVIGTPHESSWKSAWLWAMM